MPVACCNRRGFSAEKESHPLRHVVASFISLATTFYAQHQKSSRAHSAATPSQIKPASLGFDSAFCPSALALNDDLHIASPFQLEPASLGFKLVFVVPSELADIYICPKLGFNLGF